MVHLQKVSFQVLKFPLYMQFFQGIILIFLKAIFHFGVCWSQKHIYVYVLECVVAELPKP